MEFEPSILSEYRAVKHASRISRGDFQPNGGKWRSDSHTYRYIGSFGSYSSSKKPFKSFFSSEAEVRSFGLRNPGFRALTLEFPALFFSLTSVSEKRSEVSFTKAA